MKVKLAYPKIPDSKGFLPKRCYAFAKYDGTNLHWVWDNEWLAFGTRRDRFPLTDEGIYNFNVEHPGLEESTEIFLGDYGKRLHNILSSDYPSKRVTVFTEFFGNNSFAGNHYDKDAKRLVLFDVQVDDIIVPPNIFLRQFCLIDHALPVYEGKFTGQFVEDVRNGKYHVDEGVVCKGIYKNELYMCKIKTNAYMEKLKSSFKDKWKDYWE